MPLLFEWDDEKAKSNLIKHGISFDEAKSVFYDYFAIMSLDTEHSITEERYALIGYSINNRILYISFTERKNIIRIISSRKTTKNERSLYEKNYKNNRW
jgi:uncharacterized protein